MRGFFKQQASQRCLGPIHQTNLYVNDCLQSVHIAVAVILSINSNCSATCILFAAKFLSEFGQAVGFRFVEWRGLSLYFKTGQAIAFTVQFVSFIHKYRVAGF